MKKIHLNEIYKSFQGEGSKCGTPCVFVRLAGCNFWSGKEAFRYKGIGECSLWCDSNFLKKFSMSTNELKIYIEDLVSSNNQGVSFTGLSKNKCVIFTGGEPMLQLRNHSKLFLSLLSEGWTVCVETNGTIDCDALKLLNRHPMGHITMSPKLLKNYETLEHINLRYGTDLKIIFPTLIDLKEVKKWDFENIFLQPKDEGQCGLQNLNQTIKACESHGYRLSLQTHKFVGYR